jgi:hypothetical protein
LIDFDAPGPVLELKLDELRGKAEQLFSAGGPGWPVARYHSPDVMLSARSVEAIEAGDYQWVLGEVHPGSNTIVQPAFADLHDDAQALFDMMAEDLSRQRISSNNSHRATGHRTPASTFSPHDLYFIFDDTPSACPADKQLAAGDLYLTRQDQHLQVVTRDGRRQFPIADFFHMLLRYGCATGYSFLPHRRYTPRICLDRLVLARQRWRVPCGELGFARAESSIDRFTALRRWFRENNIPRRVFVRVASENKPVYLDANTPLSVDIVARMIRTEQERDVSSDAIISEMLPDPQQCWLTDKQGHRYTCELRTAALDELQWRESAAVD